MNKTKIQKTRNDNRVSFRLPEKQLSNLKYYSSEMEMSVGEFVRKLADLGLQEYLQQRHEQENGESYYV